MIARRILTALAALAFFLLMFAPTVSAHASATSADGKVRVTWGLLTEPGYTHERNGLDLILRDAETMAGIGGVAAEDITELTLNYGEESYDLGELSANTRAKRGGFAGDGNYTSENSVFLTRPGIYTLHIRGTIAGSEIDLEIPAAHEYHEISEIMFPQQIEFGGAGDTSALEERIATLETEIAALKAQSQTQSTTPATLTPQASAETNDAPAAGALLAAVAAVGAALVLRRK